jgi:hypothetical protein
MLRMVVGHSDDVDPDAAVDEAVAACRRELGDVEPAAGLLFSGFDNDSKAVHAAARAALPDIRLVGSTSAAEMSSALGYREDSVAIALFASDVVEFRAGAGHHVLEDPNAAVLEALDAAGASEAATQVCFAVTTMETDATAVVEALRRELGDDVAIVGGGSAPPAYAPQFPLSARQFCNDEVVEDGVAVLLLSGPLVYSVGVDTGWRPVGRRGTVTRASANVIQEIDGEPAAAFYERYLGKGAAAAEANPLAVYEDGGELTYLRVPAYYDRETGAIAMAGNAVEGSQVQLTVAVTEEIFEGTRSAISKAIDGYPATSSPDAALVFSCAVRKRLLGTRSATEIEIARQRLGPDVPIAGLYCYGEIAPLESGFDHFHNETIVAVLLGETGP